MYAFADARGDDAAGHMAAAVLIGLLAVLCACSLSSCAIQFDV